MHAWTRYRKRRERNICPLKPGPSINGGRIGKVVLTSLSNFDSGKGPSARIDFIIGGETTLNGKLTAVGQKGTITISTPPWGRFLVLLQQPGQDRVGI